MKKTILAILVMAICMVSNAQLQVVKTAEKVLVGKCSNAGSTIAELSYEVDAKDTVYTLRFNNHEYRTIDDYKYIKFNEEGGTLDQFYDLFMSFLSDENKNNKDYSVTLQLGKNLVTIKKKKVMGIVNYTVYTDKGYFPLTERQVNKLFGR